MSCASLEIVVPRQEEFSGATTERRSPFTPSSQETDRAPGARMAPQKGYLKDSLSALYCYITDY